ncbi:MAG: hypothetical protein U0894_08090 [Pirellulales bacterium]
MSHRHNKVDTFATKSFALIRLLLTATAYAVSLAAMPLSAQDLSAEPVFSTSEFSTDTSFRYRKSLFQWFEDQPQFPESTSDRIDGPAVP